MKINRLVSTHHEMYLLMSLLLASVSASPVSSHQRSMNEGHGYRETQVTTSPFLRIIRTDDPAIRDAIYTTPAVVYVGTKSQLLRCLYEDPTTCEVVFNAGTWIRAVHLFDNNVYAGVGQVSDGKILKCKLNQKDSCETFKTTGSSVLSLASADKVLYAGCINGTIIRCDIHEVNSCRPLHELGNFVYSLIHFDGYIYAGLENGKVFRCSLTTINSCTLVYTMTDEIFGFSRVENSVLAVTKDNRMWNCTLKPHAADDNCVSVPIHNFPRNVAYFRNTVYTVEGYNSIHICNNTTCSSYVNIEGAFSIAFVYGTYHMQSRYNEEDVSSSWQRGATYPPGVVYYNDQQRAQFKVHIKHGKLYNSAGALVDTGNADEGRSGPAAIFVMRPDGTVLLSNRHVHELLHTSSLFAGKPVAGAGEMTVRNGVIQQIRACSQHYRPDTNLNRQVVESLRAQGYTAHIDSVMCDDHEFGQLGSENNQ